jgi:hypothetical protein
MSPLIKWLPSGREGPKSKVEFIEPMLAPAVTKLPEGAAWSGGAGSSEPLSIYTLFSRSSPRKLR